jgi:hypothetical protein
MFKKLSKSFLNGVVELGDEMEKVPGFLTPNTNQKNMK